MSDVSAVPYSIAGHAVDLSSDAIGDERDTFAGRQFNGSIQRHHRQFS